MSFLTERMARMKSSNHIFPLGLLGLTALSLGTTASIASGASGRRRSLQASEGSDAISRISLADDRIPKVNWLKGRLAR